MTNPVGDASQLPPQPDRGLILTHAMVARVGLVITGAFLLYMGLIISSFGSPSTHFKFLLAIYACYGSAFLCFLLGAKGVASTQLANLLILGVISGAMFLGFWSTLENTKGIYIGDSIAFAHESAKMVLHGENPYAVRDRESIRQIAKKYNVLALTPEADGQITHQLVAYPAGHFLFFLPWVAIGLHDIRWVTTSCTILAIVIMWLAAPRILRPLVALPVIVDFGHAFLFPIGGAADEIWVLPVMGVVIALNRRRFDMAAVIFGLACAIKQQPWLLAPFLLIWIWHESEAMGWRERLKPTLRFAAISVLAFLLPNLPFILWQPVYWFKGVGYQFFEDIVTYGIGLAALTNLGYLTLSKDVFSLIAATALAVLLAAYWRYFGSLKHCIWVFPPIVLWFTYRSLAEYFFYWAPIVMLGVLIQLRIEEERPAQRHPSDAS